MSEGGAMTNAVLKKMGQFLTKAEKVPAVPLNIPRAAPKTKEEIDKIATRVAKQMTGEHVLPEGSTKKVNLVGRSMRESERVKNLPYQIQPTGASQKAEAYIPKIGDVNVAIPGDQTISDSILRHVGDLEDINSVQEGGSKYGLGKMSLENPLFWASSEEPAQMAQDKITRLAGYYQPERVIGQHMAMGPVSNNFAMHLADANLRSTTMHIADGKISPEQMNSFDNIIANGFVKKNSKTGEYEHFNFPQWPGIADPEGAYKAMRENPELRKWYNSRMKTPDITSAHGLPNGLDIQWAITEPALRNMEVNLTGLSAGKMVPGAELTDTASHNTYNKGIQGLALQPQTPPGPFEILYPDATQHVRATKNPSDFTGTIQKVFPHQLVDDQYLNEVGQYNDLIKKYTGQKKGGKVHMAGGGALVDKIVEKLGRVVLPRAEREANFEKLIDKSADKRKFFHGSKEPNITEFKTRKQISDENYANDPSNDYRDERNAVFLSPDPHFTRHFSVEGYTDKGQAPTTYPVHVQIKNPFDFENPNHRENLWKTYQDIYYNPKSELYAHGPYDTDSEKTLAEIRMKKRIFDSHKDENNWPLFENPTVQEAIKDMGHDSFYINERGTKNLGVYDPSVIKSAIGNEGTYDVTNPDMNKRKGGKVHVSNDPDMMRHELKTRG